MSDAKNMGTRLDVASIMGISAMRPAEREIRGRRRSRPATKRKIVADPRDPIDAHIGASIRRRRAMLNVTQTMLAEQIGLSFQAVQKYESAENKVSASRLSQIATLLDVPISYFFHGSEERAETTNLAAEEEQILLQVVKPLMTLSIDMRKALVSHIREVARCAGTG